MKAYSLNLKQRAVASVLRGDQMIPEVAGLFGVSTTLVNVMLRLRRAADDFPSHGGGLTLRLQPGHGR